jgi:hypothetical protein
MPSQDEFYEYTGEHISGKLSGDMKNQDDLLEILFKRCYREILSSLPGVRKTDLSDDDKENWKILLMEQAEYYLSVGDKVLSGEDVIGLSPKIPDLAQMFGLWTRYFYVNFK